MSFWIKKIDQPHETRIVLTWNRGWDRMKLVIIPLGLALFAILPLLLSSVDLIDLDYLQLSLSLKRLATFITGLLLLLCLGFYFFAKAFNNSHFVFAHQDYALKRKHSPFFWGRIKTIDLKKSIVFSCKPSIPRTKKGPKRLIGLSRITSTENKPI